jgi:hypothetical protein
MYTALGLKSLDQGIDLLGLGRPPPPPLPPAEMGKSVRVTS